VVLVLRAGVGAEMLWACQLSRLASVRCQLHVGSELKVQTALQE
jgi:hypothetical protein